MQAVIRDCCTSGNCDTCNDVTPVGKCLAVWQGDWPESDARRAADNWKSYNARVVSVEDGVRVRSELAAAIASRRLQYASALGK